MEEFSTAKKLMHVDLVEVKKAPTTNRKRYKKKLVGIGIFLLRGLKRVKQLTKKQPHTAMRIDAFDA